MQRGPHRGFALHDHAQPVSYGGIVGGFGRFGLTEPIPATVEFRVSRAAFQVAVESSVSFLDVCQPLIERAQRAVQFLDAAGEFVETPLPSSFPGCRGSIQAVSATVRASPRTVNGPRTDAATVVAIVSRPPY
ncbi:hypothetical protein IQ251_00155 [Saccharopolyspora sp. HNM0983]|uniref:Uncharacterized protein n=1 Tax=Saccharopolyspora montiporae TaxID=2781240 RepID=A0A929B859_9PSEU|nr:hypothetical protein [Saccharopolyspora sp. HNM0983]MBE9372852.1 hypothetical protein [Saccharopolyspora sp. HNM0983]